METIEDLSERSTFANESANESPTSCRCQSGNFGNRLLHDEPAQYLFSTAKY